MNERWCRSLLPFMGLGSHHTTPQHFRERCCDLEADHAGPHSYVQIAPAASRHGGSASPGTITWTWAR
jgi:hypothetical protein